MVYLLTIYVIFRTQSFISLIIDHIAFVLWFNFLFFIFIFLYIVQITISVYSITYPSNVFLVHSLMHQKHPLESPNSSISKI